MLIRRSFCTLERSRKMIFSNIWKDSGRSLRHLSNHQKDNLSRPLEISKKVTFPRLSTTFHVFLRLSNDWKDVFSPSDKEDAVDREVTQAEELRKQSLETIGRRKKEQWKTKELVREMANEEEHQMEQSNICERKAKVNRRFAYRKWRSRNRSWPIEERRQKFSERCYSNNNTRIQL